MNRRCAAHRCRPSLRQSDMTNLARLHEIRHGADGFFNRRAWIDAMLIVEIDRVNTEPLQARVATRLHVLGLTTDAAQTRIRLVAHDSELRRKKNLVAPAANRF